MPRDTTTVREQADECHRALRQLGRTLTAECVVVRVYVWAVMRVVEALNTGLIRLSTWWRLKCHE